MKKILFVIISCFVLVAIYYYFKNIYGWMDFRNNTDTPDKFLNKTVVKKEDYKSDSLKITNQLKNLLMTHAGFFHSKEYFEGTQLIIDTIIYSPDFKKLATLIITKNPTSRQLIPIQDEPWYYNSTCYLGTRVADSITLSRLGPDFTNSTDRKDISNYIRNACFRTFVSRDTTGPFAYKYNLIDIRFWTSSVWEKIEEDKLKKKKFDEEKIKHPENVYEPQK